MKYRYTKFTGDVLDELDLEDLVSKLSDLLLSSGFGNPYGAVRRRGRPDDAGAARRDPRCAVQRRRAAGRDDRAAARRGRQQAEDARAAARGADPADHRADGQQGYITTPPDLERRARSGARAGGGGRAGQPQRHASRSPTRASTSSATARCATCSARSARAASAGTTRASMATGVETTGAPKPYEFGDTLNLDASAHAAERGAARQRDERGSARRAGRSTSTTKI